MPMIGIPGLANRSWEVWLRGVILYHGHVFMKDIDD